MLRYLLSDSTGKVAPEQQQKVVKICSLCIEPGGMKRPCCNALYCDHCYTKNEKCPNCGVPTRQEKLTGATFQMKIFSEHEECRVCLEPGLQRRCCNNYYCDSCYYKLPTCRSCGAQVGHVGDENKFFNFDQAALLTNCLGWGVTVFLAFSVTAFLAVLIAAEVETPVGINDYHCYGFFRTCGMTKCIEMTQDEALGKDPLPALSDWKECDLSSPAKLIGKACPYDRLLYFQSDRTLGYDICSENFNEGIYVFEDTFEDWTDEESYTSSQMATARWHNVINGITSDFCGVGEHFGRERSLSFQGEAERYAETKDLDMTTGGRLQAELFLPPEGFSDGFCRTAAIGKVRAEYSTDGGGTDGNWTLLKEYDPLFYRQKKFFKVDLPLPEIGRTNQTRFRFIQPTFLEVADHWALDNVRVLRNLEDDWQTRAAFQRNLERANEEIQKAQCCLDTDWCARRFSESETEQCDDFSWYDGENYLFRLSEIFLCITLLLNVLKFLYISGQDWNMKTRLPFQDEWLEFLNIPIVQRMYKRLPLQCRPRKRTPDAFTHEIHESARMEEALRAEFNDEEGEGEMLKQQETVEEERRKAEKRLKKAKKRLEERKKKKNFKSSVVEDMVEEEAEEQKKAVESKVIETKKDGFRSVQTGEAASIAEVGSFAAADKIADDKDRFHRQNHAMLRVPFEVDESRRWRTIFGVSAIFVFSVIFLFELSYIKRYSITESVKAYGSSYLRSDLTISSEMLVLFAAVCDVKEIFYTLKYVIPFRDKWLPTVTLDLSDDVRSLVVANFVIPVAEIREYGAFTENYAIACMACYVGGVFPWCLFALLLREAVLQYSSMRIVTPLLGCIQVLRAVLGAGFILKIGVALSFLFDMNFKTRESMGVAFQTDATKYAALNTCLAATLLGVFIFSAAAFEWLLYVFLICFVGGAIYGAFTGCIHNLPIRPWMYITTLRGGIWMRVRKSQRCPCVYWGRYCTDLHNYEEVFMLFLTDEVKYMSLINGGMAALHGLEDS